MDLNKELQLIEKAKESLEAFDEIYEYYLPKIYSYIYNRCRNKEITEDVTSQTFIQGMMKLKSFKFKGFRFGSWLYRIAQNCLVDYFRKHPDQMKFEEKESEDEQTDEIALKDERKKIILEVISKLPSAYQEILTLKYFEDLSNDEMSEILGCSKATLSVKIHRSLKSLKKLLDKNNLSSNLLN